MEIKIGTRGSKLAMVQAEQVAEALNNAGHTTKLVAIETKGDKILDVSLHKIGSKGVFTEELEDMLRSGEIDIAVHSAKDLPSKMPAELELIAFGKREDANDVLISSNQELKLESDTMTIGTSSTRRVAMLRRFFPQHRIVDMRGNLLTRMEKLNSGHCHAMILAYAGVKRLGLTQHICQQIAKDIFVPAVGQGSVAIQAKSNQTVLKQIVATAFHDESTGLEIEMERAFLFNMDGGCSVPVFGHAQFHLKQITMSGGIISLDGQQMVSKTITTMMPKKLEEKKEKVLETGALLANMVLQDGGKSILTEIKSQLNLN
jgi:hydroxymethylbilane synthase